MPDSLSYIKELIIFYVKTNYDTYLKDNELTIIEESKLLGVITELYSKNKEHLRSFILTSMKKLLKDECPSDLVINNIINEIYNDDILNIQTLLTEIKLYQINNQKK
jgi:hypothetical protein|tara:strand:+ start:1776 stop:2096 length:321 start_codon:yes stop_codon:yes gene_type:complete